MAKIKQKKSKGTKGGWWRNIKKRKGRKAGWWRWKEDKAKRQACSGSVLTWMGGEETRRREQ